MNNRYLKKAGSIGLFPLVALLAAFYFIYKIVTRAGYMISPQDAPKPKGNAETQKTLELVTKQRSKDLKVNAANLRRDMGYYTETANLLYREMNSYLPWKQETIKNLILGVNPVHRADEIKQIYKEFGHRKQTIFTISSGHGGDLLYWLSSFLTEDNYNEVYERVFKFTGLAKRPYRGISINPFK